MADLSNSQRVLRKATYVPTKAIVAVNAAGKTPNETGGAVPAPFTPTRAMAKVAYLRGLSIQLREWAALKDHPSVSAIKEIPLPASMSASPAFQQTMAARATVSKNSLSLCDLARILVTDVNPATTMKYAPLLGAVTNEDLATLGRAVADGRATIAAEVQQLSDQLLDDYKSQLPGGFGGTAGAGAIYFEAAKWGKTNDTSVFQKLYAYAKAYAADAIAANSTDPAWAVACVTRALTSLQSCTTNLVTTFVASSSVEPVGRLHLERMEMTPVGIEHGELVHSVPLTPGETVNISQREWSTTTQTFEQLIEDYKEGFSETGVAEKTDLMQATDTESKHTSDLAVKLRVTVLVLFALVAWACFAMPTVPSGPCTGGGGGGPPGPVAAIPDTVKQ